MKQFLLFLPILFLTFSGFSQEFSTIPSGSLVACGADQVIIVDPNRSSDSTSIVWSWSTKEAQGKIPDAVFKHLVPLDECKPIDNNKKLLLTSSGGATCILDIEKKEIEFYARTPMAHSADTLPGGYIVVANSTHPRGNSIELYHRSQSDQRLIRDSLYSGHGVVWNPSTQRLYALGYNELRVYQFSSNSTSPALTMENKYLLPENRAHDLTLIDDHRLLLTTPPTPLVFNIKKHSFFPFQPLENKRNLKSVNYEPRSKKLVYTRAEESWWTYHIYGKNPLFKIYIPQIKLYKVRPAW